MNKEIPAEVIKEAEGLINMFWENIKYLGTYADAEYYQFVFPEDTVTWFPFVYIYYKQKWQVMEITWFDALDIIGKFYKD